MKKIQVLLCVLMVGLLTACSKVSSPEQIATYPKEEPIATYPRAPESKLIYNATLELEVTNVERSVERAKEIAFEQGGYLVSAQSWYRDGAKHSTVVLAIPSHRYDHALDELLGLGKLVGEWISSEMVSPNFTTRDIYTQITVFFHPSESKFPEISFPNWRPVRTFEKALGVFISIFGFLIDIIIWVVVVVGPFVAIGFGILKVYHWRRKVINKGN